MHEVRTLTLIAALASFPVEADLYRWVDRETGSVKFSNTPPPWFGDAAKERGAPAVEVIPYRGHGGGPGGVPSKPAAAPRPSAPASVVADLEARWARLTQFFATLSPTTDLIRAGAALQQQLDAYQALSAELDRVDPAGTPRRRVQELGVLDRLRKGMEAQLAEQPGQQ
jgi:hypothetical protein